MKLVIDIGEKRFEDIQRIASIQIKRKSLTCEQIIANGTPLPECKTCQEWNTNKPIDGACYCCNWHNYTGEDFYCGDWVRKTIIEADKPKRKAGTPLEENDSGYNCENWIP